MFPPLNRLSVHPVKDKSIKHDVGRQSYKILKYADGAQFLCCRLVIASRVNQFTKKPRSLTIIKLASNTAPLPVCLSNCHLSFPPSCTPFLYQHTLWLTSLLSQGFIPVLTQQSASILTQMNRLRWKNSWPNQTDSGLD